MNGLIHKLIVQSAASMLPAELGYYLDKSAEGEPGKTKLDLILEGATKEDSTTEAGPLGNPSLQDIPPAIASIFFKDYWPWMEHFWNDELADGKGLTVTAESLGKLLGLGLGSVGGFFAGGLIGEQVILAQFHTVLDRAAEYWNTWVLAKYNAGEHDEALKNLGRVLHLLADVGTPCHVHGDMHMNILEGYVGFDDDDYEQHTSEHAVELGEQLDGAWIPTAGSGIVWNPDWDLSKYFHELGEISRLYDSDDYDGLGEDRPYHWNHWLEHASDIVPIERDISGDLTDLACYTIASDLVPITIRFTAGLLCHFFGCIGYSVALDMVEVSVKNIHVYDDTDPHGSGEIFLSAGLNTKLIQIGGQWDIDSGHWSAISGADLPPIAVDNPTVPVHFYAHAFDDDSNFLYEDSESLGNIDYAIDLTTLDPANPVTLRVNSVGGSGSFGLDIEIRFQPMAQEIASYSTIIGNFDRWIMKDISVLRKTTYNENYTPPLLLNLETMAVHGLSSHGRCKTWEKMNSGKKLELHMWPYEVFEEVDGKTRLARIVEKIHGENSKQAKRVAGVKEFTGYCSCLRKGWGTKVT
jgi:hypothetical protein